MSRLALMLAVAGGATGAGYGALSYFEPGSGPSWGTAPVTVVATDRPGYPVDSFEAKPQAGPIIRAFGIYEGGSGHGGGVHPRYPVQIEVGDQHGQPLYLALSSYEPVDWKLTGPGVVSVLGVYLAGYNRHSVDGVPQGLVINGSGQEQRERDAERARQLEEGGWGAQQIPQPIACTYTFSEPSGGGCESAANLVRNAQAAFRAPLASFAGVYNAQVFRIAERLPAIDASGQPSSRSRPNPWSIETGH